MLFRSYKKAGCLFYRIGGSNFNAFNTDSRLGYAELAHDIRPGAGRIPDFFQDIIPFDDLAECRIATIQLRLWGKTDKKLAAGRVRASGIGHRKHPALVASIWPGIGFAFDGVTGATLSILTFLGWILGVGVATLNHKTLDDAMETGAIIKTVAGEFLEVGDGGGRDVRPELDDHRAFSRVDDRNFAGADGVRRLIDGRSVCRFSLAA